MSEAIFIAFDRPLVEFDADAIEACIAVLGLEENSREVRRARHDLADLPSYAALQGSRHRIREPRRYQRELGQLSKLCERLHAKPRPDQAERLLAKVDDLTGQARRSLWWHLEEQEDRVDAPGVSKHMDDHERVERAARNDILSLRDAARAASEDLGKRVIPGRGGSRHRTDHCRDETLDMLALRYWEYTRQNPGISVDFSSKQPSGRFLNLVQICFRQLGWNDTAHSIRHRFRKLRDEQRDLHRRGHRAEEYYLD